MGNPNKSAYKFPSTMNSFFYQPVERCKTQMKNNDNSRLYATEGVRLPSRQLIPQKNAAKGNQSRVSTPDTYFSEKKERSNDYGDLGQAR